MPNLLETSADWIGEQLQAHCGKQCTYFKGADSIDLLLVPVVSRQPIDGQYTGRLKDFTAPASALAIDGDVFLPEPLDEIEWTDNDGEPRIAVVFPRPADANGGANDCFRFSDPSEKLLRIYTVDQDSLVNVALLSGGQTASFVGVPSVIRGAEQFDGLDTTKLLTTSVYLLRSKLEAAGFHTPPMMASVDVHDLVGWSVDMANTEWGEVLVKLGLQRETLTREWQARRSAI